MVTVPTDRVTTRKDATLPYIGLEHLASGSPDLVGAAASTESVSTNSVFEQNDILFGKLRPNLRKSVLAPFKGYCSTDLLVLRPNPDVVPGFVARVFQSNQVFRAAVATAIGTKMPRTSWAALKSLQVFCPLAPEQQLVAEIFDTIDDAIRKTSLVIAKLVQANEGLLRDLLTRGIGDNGKVGDPERHAVRFKRSPLGTIPTDWEVRPFADFASPRRPFLKTGPFGSSLKGEHWVAEGVPVITIGALGEGELVRSELLYVSESTARILSAYAVQPGDIVFSRVADVGRSVVVPANAAGWIMSSNLMWISLDPSQVHPHFVWLNLSGNFMVRSQIRRAVNAGGREIANGPVLRSLMLAWPPLPEQKRIVEYAGSLAARRNLELEKLTKLQLIRQGLLDDLLTGRVRMKAAKRGTR